jgi:hypothetical protein
MHPVTSPTTNPPPPREQSREPWIANDRSIRAGPAPRAPVAATRSDVHFAALATLALGIGPHYRDFLRRLRCALASAAVSEPRSPHHDLVSAADRGGHQILRDLGTLSYEGLRTRVTTLDSLAAYNSVDGELTGRGEPVQVPALAVSPNFFDTWVSAPPRPRVLTGAAAPDDDRSAIVSDRLWRTSLEADPAIVGQSITIDGSPVRRRRAAAGLQLQAGDPRLGALPEADIFLPNRWPGDTGKSAFLSCWAA